MIHRGDYISPYVVRVYVFPLYVSQYNENLEILMTKKDVQIGATYAMNHSSGRIRVRILMEKASRMYGGRNGVDRVMTHWLAVNLKTGRTIEIKSATKLTMIPPASPIENEKVNNQ